MEQDKQSWGDRQTVTLQDVAKSVGVSTSAASVVLNGTRSGTRVSSERRLAVLEAAERLGYRPNALARSLTTGRTHRVGVYSGKSRLDSRNSFFSELLGGIVVAAGEFRQNTMIHSTGWDLDGLLDLVSNRALDALIVHAAENDPIIPLLGELCVPAVAVADRVESLPSVVADDAAGGELQAYHLSSLGHRHVLVKRNPHPVGSSALRMASFMRTAEKLGLEVTARYETYHENDGLDPSDIETLRYGPNRATAVVAWSDHVAQRVCDRLDILGIAIPKEVAVMGFDGTVHSCTPRHILTTIHAPWAKVGSTAVALLNKLIDGEAVPTLTVLPVEFVLGATT